MTAYLKYAAQGIAVFPCHRNKTPATQNGFYDASTDTEKLDQMFGIPNALIGLPTGHVNGIVVIDFDIYKSHISYDELKELINEEFGELPDTLTIETQSGGFHLYYKIESETKTRTKGRFLKKEFPVDIRSNGGYVCAPGDYNFYVPIDVEDDEYWNDLRSLCSPLPEWIENFQKIADEKPVKEFETLPPSEIVEIRSALSFIDPCCDRDTWINVGMCLRSTNSPSGFFLWDEWSKGCKTKYNPGEMQETWDSFHSVKDLTLGTLFHYAKEKGWVSTYTSHTPIELIDLDEIDEKRNHEKQPFPQHLLNPPGIVGEIINHINTFSKKKQPILALGAALSAAGTIMGQRFQTDQGLRTNVYILGVGESGCGKDAARSAIKRLFENAGIGELAGTEDLASDAAVITALSENPSQLFLIDEIGRFLKTTNLSSAKNSHLYNIISILLKLYSSASQEFRGKSYADSTKKHKIDSPNLCIYGTTVPRSLFEGLTVENITDGFLSRFLIFESEDADPEPSGRRKFALQRIDKSLVEKVMEIWNTPRNIIDKGNVAQQERVKPLIVQMSDEAEDMAIGYEEYIYNKRKELRKNEGLDSVYNRAAQFAEQLALIIGVGRNHIEPIIEFEDMQYAIELTNYLTDRMHFIARHYISNNELESNFKKVLNMIRDYGKQGMTRSQFSRKTQFLAKHIREDILDSLQAAGQIKIAINENGRTIIYPIKEMNE